MSLSPGSFDDGDKMDLKRMWHLYLKDRTNSMINKNQYSTKQFSFTVSYKPVELKWK